MKGSKEPEGKRNRPIRPTPRQVAKAEAKAEPKCPSPASPPSPKSTRPVHTAEPLPPILNRYRPTGTTAGVDFPTTRPVTETAKSHINLVVQHSDWEHQAALVLEKADPVAFYARNDHLGLVIPYEFMGQDHSYEPDFIVRLQNETNLLLEIKGFEVHDPEKTHQKHNAASRWVSAVNNLGDFGKWDFLVCRDVAGLSGELSARV